LPGQLDGVVGEEDVNAVGEWPLASLDHDATDQGAQLAALLFRREVIERI